MNTQNKRIIELQDFEIIDFLKTCSELFGTQLKESTAGAFIFILRNKFQYTTDTQIVNACLEYSANPNNERQRFSPFFLASMIRSKNKEKLPTYTYDEKTPSEIEQIKKQWLSDLYKGFEDYCDKKEIKTIFIWNYLAKKLMQAGLVTKEQHENAHLLNTSRSKSRQEVGGFRHEFADGYKELCEMIFHNIAMEGKHIKEYVM